MERNMSMTDGMNIIDNALNLALSDLESHGMQGDDAQIALLVRLSNLVPEEVFNVASLLRDDAELMTAMNSSKNASAPAMSEG
jgi:hypothetical protein